MQKKAAERFIQPIIFTVLIGILLTGCTEGNMPEQFDREDEDELCVLEKPDFVIERERQDSIKRVELETLLSSPINLEAYKEKYGTSNSGAGMNSDLFAIPEEEGFMYKYLLFHKLRKALPDNPSEADLFNGFKIHVYKFGTEVGDWYSTEEELMAIECQLDNPTLGKLNVFGMVADSIFEQFGEPQFRTGDHFIYTHENNTWVMHFNEEEEERMVDWYKYARLNDQIDLQDDIPEFLLTY